VGCSLVGVLWEAGVWALAVYTNPVNNRVTINNIEKIFVFIFYPFIVLYTYFSMG
jgi:hypothetical protein